MRCVAWHLDREVSARQRHLADNSPMAMDGATIDTRIDPQVPADLRDRVLSLIRERTNQAEVRHVPSLLSSNTEAAICDQVRVVVPITGHTFILHLEQLDLDDLDAFVVVDAAFCIRKFQRWSELIPRVKPHFGKAVWVAKSLFES